MSEWFQRFAEIPRSLPWPTIERFRRPYSHAVRELQVYDFEGKNDRSRSCLIDDRGSPSASLGEERQKALEVYAGFESTLRAGWEFVSSPSVGAEVYAGFLSMLRAVPTSSNAANALRELYAGFERPGEPRHYHFAIQGCSETLWKFRRDEPWVIEQVEVLCWLDIQLIETYPDAVAFKRDGETQYDNVDAFYRLIKLYENDGYLEEAVDVASRAIRFNQAQHHFERLQARIAQLEAEDAN
jgi:hypothetical protein